MSVNSCLSSHCYMLRQAVQVAKSIRLHQPCSCTCIKPFRKRHGLSETQLESTPAQRSMLYQTSVTRLWGVYLGGSAGWAPGRVHTVVANPMLPTALAVPFAAASTAARSWPASAAAPATCPLALLISQALLVLKKLWSHHCAYTLRVSNANV